MESSWPLSYGRWIYNYICNQCLSPLMLWVRISIRARCTTLCDKVYQWLTTSLWFSPGPPVSSTNKTDRHDITEILLKVALNIIKPNQTIYFQNVYNQIYHFKYVYVSITIDPVVRYKITTVEYKIENLKISKRGNQNPYIEEEQTTQWPKEKVQKYKQRSTKHTHKWHKPH